MSKVPADDWRRQGQERYLVGVTLKRMRWSSKTPAWDHDHCDFCGTKIASDDIADSLHEAYATLDLYH